MRGRDIKCLVEFKFFTYVSLCLHHPWAKSKSNENVVHVLEVSDVVHMHHDLTPRVSICLIHQQHILGLYFAQLFDFSLDFVQ